MSARFYRTAFAISFGVNVILLAGFWYYLSIEGTLSWVQTVVGIFN